MSARRAGWRVAALGAVLAAGGAWHAVLILVLLAMVLWADQVAGALARAAAAVRARQRRGELGLRLGLQAALARKGQALPVRCAHRQALPVPGVGGNVVAWLCPHCDAQLPADFSAPGEDS